VKKRRRGCSAEISPARLSFPRPAPLLHLLQPLRAGAVRHPGSAEEERFQPATVSWLYPFAPQGSKRHARKGDEEIRLV